MQLFRKELLEISKLFGNFATFSAPFSERCKNVGITVKNY